MHSVVSVKKPYDRPGTSRFPSFLVKLPIRIGRNYFPGDRSFFPMFSHFLILSGQTVRSVGPEQGTLCRSTCNRLIWQEKNEGILELLDALQSSALASRQWKATLAGDGPVGSYRALVSKMGLQDRVSLPGWVGR